MDPNLTAIITWLTPFFAKAADAAGAEAGKTVVEKVNQLIPRLAGKKEPPQIEAEITVAVQSDSSLLMKLEELIAQFESQRRGSLVGSVTAQDNAKVVMADTINAREFKF